MLDRTGRVRARGLLRVICERTNFLEQSESDSSTVSEFPNHLDYEHLAVREYAFRASSHD